MVSPRGAEARRLLLRAFMERVFLALALFASGCIENMQNTVVVDLGAGEDDGGDADPRALTAFDLDLAGWGVWSEDETYGTIWTPSDAEFVPYGSHGHFVDLEGKVLWVSDVPWGKATLHHGRWVLHDGRWSWVPGMTYAPAWVQWSDDGEKTMWSPAPPTFVWRGRTAVRVTPPKEPVVGAVREGVLAFGVE